MSRAVNEALMDEGWPALFRANVPGAPGAVRGGFLLKPSFCYFLFPARRKWEMSRNAAKTSL